MEFEQGGGEAVPVGTEVNDDLNGIVENETVEETVEDPASQQEASTAADETPAEEWDGSKYVLKFRGKEIIPKSREELINLAQQGHQYSQKISALNQQRDQLNAQAQRYNELEKLIKAIEENPEFKQYIFNYKQTGQQQETGAIDQNVIKQMIQPHLQEVTSVKEELEAQKADIELEKETAALKSKYPNEDWDSQDENGRTYVHDVYEHALNSNLPLETAYRDLKFPTIATNAEAEALKRKQEQEAANRKKGIVSPGGSQVQETPKKVNVRKASMNDLAEMAANDPNFDIGV